MFGNQLKKQAQLRESAMMGVVMLLLCYASYTNFYVPKKTAVVEIGTQLDETIKKKQQLEEMIGKLRKNFEEQKRAMQMQAQMARQANERLKILTDKKASLFKDISEFLNAVVQPSFKAAVSINGMKYEPSLVKPGYTQTVFTLNVTGRFQHIQEFIEKLEKIPALITIDKVNIQVNKKDNNMVNLDLNGTFYLVETGQNG